MNNNIEYSKILKDLEKIEAEIEELLSDKWISALKDSEKIEAEIEELLTNQWITALKDNGCCIFCNGEESRIITADYINALFE